MSTIASLSVALDMDTARFSSGTRSARGDLRALANAAEIATGGMIAAFASAKLRQALDYTTEAIREQTAQISSLVDQANRLGTGFAPLAALSRSAGLAGADFETLSKGLDRFQRMLGSGAAGKTLKSLGLDLEALRGKSVDEAFLDVADAIRNTAGESDQAAAAYALFGRSGQELTVLLKQGSEELRRQAAEAQALGLVLDNTTAGSVEEMGDAWDDAKNAGSGFWRQLTGALAPALQALADTGTELIAGEHVLTKTFDEQRLQAQKLDAQLRQLHKDREALARQPKKIDTTSQLGRDVALQQLLRSESHYATEKAASDAYAEMRAALKEEIELFGKSKREIDLYNLAKMGATREGVAHVRALSAQLDAMEREKAALERTAADRRAAREDLEADAKAIFEATRTPQEQFATEMQRLDKLLAAGVLSWDTYNRAARQALETLAEAEGARLPTLDSQGAAPAALEKGSVAAASAIAEQRSGLKRIEDLNRLGLNESQQQTQLLRTIAANQAPATYTIPG